MAVPRLEISERNAFKIIDQLQVYKDGSVDLQVRYQHFISEIIMLRLFSVFEEYVAEVAYKIAAGATYTNGVVPKLNARAGNVSGSRSLFLSYGRPKQCRYLKWTKASCINDSVSKVIPSSESFLIQIQNHGAIIDEMRKVRNMAAHNSPTARTDYKSIVRRIYGANLKITLGAFLSSTKRTPMSNLDRYLRDTKTIFTDIVTGY